MSNYLFPYNISLVDTIIGLTMLLYVFSLVDKLKKLSQRINKLIKMKCHFAIDKLQST